mgnify:CR=1 FL=1
MPALNFQKQFADKVEKGEKRQTIRKRPFQIGDKLYLYTGQRTKQCRKLGESVVKESYSIVIPNEDEIYFDDCILIGIEKEQLARDDGFECVADMIDWFKKTHGLPFVGYLIIW